jgi:hypothetical protein
MEQSPWKAGGSLSTQEIPRVSQNPYFHQRVHKNPSLFHILNQISTDQTIRNPTKNKIQSLTSCYVLQRL